MRRSASEIIRSLEMRVARLEKSAYLYNPNDIIDPHTYRLASFRKVAGHIILAGGVSVHDLKTDLAKIKYNETSNPSIEDIEFDDGVLTFLMSKMDDPNVEKKVKAIAKKHRVKFEKGEFTDGLGMIYTKRASRRNRRIR